MRITYSECVFVTLTYPACNAHAPYSYPWPAQLYNIFPHYLIKGTIFEKKNIEHKTCVLSTILTETIFIARRTERDVIKNVYRSSCKVTFILVRF